MKKLLWLPLIVAVLVSPLAQAQHGGWDGHRSGPPMHYPYSSHYMPHGHVLRDLPLGFACLFIAGLEYYYWEGMYYRPASSGYVVVPAPVGAVVTALPPGCQTVVIDGTLYYIINGVTYMQTVNGYQVVPMPRVLVQQAATAPAATTAINVPVPSTPAPPVTVNVPAPTPWPGPPAPTSIPSASAASPAVATAPVAATENSPAAEAAATNDIFTVNIPNARGSYTAVTLKRSGNGFIGPQGEFYTEFPRIEQLKVMYGK